MIGQLRRLNPDSPREGRAGFVSAAHLARLSALRVWFALLFLVLLAGLGPVAWGQVAPEATVRHGDTGRSIQRQLVEEVLDAHPQLDYLVGNAPMAEAAVAEVRRRQRADSVGIVASYVTPGVHSGMVRGRILASVTDFPVLQGRMAVRQALRALEGLALEPYIGPRVELVDAERLKQYPIDWMLPPAGFVPVYEVRPGQR